jgi:hypothetical protein
MHKDTHLCIQCKYAGLLKDTKYELRIRVRDERGFSDYSDTFSVSTGRLTFDRSVKGTHLVLSDGDTTVTKESPHSIGNWDSSIIGSDEVCRIRSYYFNLFLTHINTQTHNNR